MVGGRGGGEERGGITLRTEASAFAVRCEKASSPPPPLANRIYCGRLDAHWLLQTKTVCLFSKLFLNKILARINVVR